MLGHGDNNRPIQHQNIQNDNTIAASAPEYQKINPLQTRIEEGLDLNKDNMIKTRTVSDRDNTEVGLDFKTDINPTQQQVPVHFLGGHNMVQYSGGLDRVPPHITIHQGFEEVPSNMGPYGQEYRGQWSHPQCYFGPNMNHLTPRLADHSRGDRIHPGGVREGDLMGHSSPLAIVNVTRHQLGAIPKESPQGTPRRGLSSNSEDPGYTDVGNDPRNAQRQIWEQCVIENNSPRDPTEVVIVADHTRPPTRVVMASDHHTRRMERESIHTESVNVTKRSQELIECI